jgi:hypothetical protein
MVQGRVRLALAEWRRYHRSDGRTQRAPEDSPHEDVRWLRRVTGKAGPPPQGNPR